MNTFLNEDILFFSNTANKSVWPWPSQAAMVAFQSGYYEGE